MADRRPVYARVSRGARALLMSVGASCVGLTSVATAHHGIANFDLNKDVALSGVVTNLAFVNPHSWLYLDVAAPNGEVAKWRCEMRAATVLKRSGWSQEMFGNGTRVRITGSPDRNEPNTCYLGTITFADGSSMDRYGQRQRATQAVPAERPERLANGVPNLNGDWAAEQRVMTDRRGISGALVPLSVAETLAPGEVPAGARAFPGARGTPESLAEDAIHTAWVRPSPVALTDAGKKAAEGFDGSSADNPRLRCEPTNILFDWTFDTLVNRIVQDENAIRLQYGFMGLERTLDLNATEHPENPAPSVAGHSIGRWDGDVLVVDTVGFKPGVLSADAVTMHSGELHVIERFSLDLANRALRREYIAVDPLYFAGEFKGADTVYAADLPYEAYGCDDRSYVTAGGGEPGAGQSATAPAPAATPAQPAPSKPWWKFWE
jgi:Family of unknown function (DUF6152)